MQPLHGGGGDLGDALADARRPGEGGHGDVGVPDEVLAGVPARARDDVDDTVGDARLGRGLREQEGGERGQLGGLEHDGVARRDRRKDLPGGHLERVVPGSDGPDDTDGFAPHVRGVVAAVLAGGLALEVPGGAREERGVVDGPGDVELAAQLEGLAALQGLGLREVLGVLGQDAREAVHRVGTLARRGAGPAGEGLAGRGHGGVDVLGAGQFVRVDVLARGRVDDCVGAAGCALGETARDVLGALGEPVLGLEAGAVARVVHYRSPPPEAPSRGAGVAPARFECRS